MKHLSHKQSIRVGEYFLEYYSFRDFNSVVSQAIDHLSHDDNVPLYGTLWPSAQVLLEELASWDLKGKKVLEIGCGLGVPSVLCALKGAEVTASDFHPDTAHYVAANCRLNGCRIRFKQLDWRQEAQIPPQDFIIASDILYEPQNYSTLAHFISQQISTSSTAIISDPKRIYSHKFIEELRKYPLSIVVEEKHSMQLFRISTEAL